MHSACSFELKDSDEEVLARKAACKQTRVTVQKESTGLLQMAGLNRVCSRSGMRGDAEKDERLLPEKDRHGLGAKS